MFASQTPVVTVPALRAQRAMGGVGASRRPPACLVPWGSVNKFWTTQTFNPDKFRVSPCNETTRNWFCMCFSNAFEFRCQWYGNRSFRVQGSQLV